ncbi:MAG TPA: DUF4142 domain-containing protein [Rhodanobacteraceae bacterium]|nr:DUF4142 domain-containing protein [Rhodanobacteraceae bacterium]
MKTMLALMLIGLLTAAAPATASGVQSLPAQAAEPHKGKLSVQDRNWLRSAHQANLAEVAAGKLAQRKGTAQSVRQVGKTLVTDHSRLDMQVKHAAARIGLDLPGQPNATQQQHARMLKQKSGSAFDRAFIHLESGRHIRAIELTSKEIHKGSSPAIKQLARATEPVLKKHLHQLKNASLKTSGSK